MTKPLSAHATTAARAEMDTLTCDPSPKIPGLVYAAVDRTGEIIFSHASGKTGLGQEEPMTLDTIFYMASCTKLLTSIACMQLVEQGKLALDDSDQLESLAPELRDVEVLERGADGGIKMVAKERRLTLRMLLNHTCKSSITNPVARVQRAQC